MAIYTYNGKILTVGNRIATGAACCCGDNEQWRDCDTDTNQAVLDSTHTDVDFAWLCIGGSYLDCYNAGTTGSTATNPTVLKQCGIGTPTDCTDLVGWPYSDNFDGTDCNSGSVGDSNWNVRWEDTGNAPAEIVSNELFLESASGETLSRVMNDNVSHAGNFTISLDFSSVTMAAVTRVHQAFLYFKTNNGTGYVIGNAVFEGRADAIRRFQVGVNGVYDFFTYTTSGDIEVVLTGTSLAFKLNSTTLTTKTISGTSIVEVRIWAYSGTSTDTCSWKVDNFSFVDGSSNEIYIDPTGQSCT